MPSVYNIQENRLLKHHKQDKNVYTISDLDEKKEHKANFWFYLFDDG